MRVRDRVGMRVEVRIRERQEERNINCREKGRDMEKKDEEEEEENDLGSRRMALGPDVGLELSIGCVQRRTLDLGPRVKV